MFIERIYCVKMRRGIENGHKATDVALDRSLISHIYEKWSASFDKKATK